ncbi:MAG: universal stress protein [Chloroflexi bacterium]|nr:universal stress protein [Chloroflexota bacterium]
MFKKILVSLDGSELAEAALPYAEPLAKQYGAKLILVEVLHESNLSSAMVTAPSAGMSLSYPDSSMTALRDQFKDEIRVVEERMDGHMERLRSDGIEAEWDVLHGNPAEGILAAAAQREVDLIIMATHGRGGLRRSVLGSVTDKVIRGTDKPVLAVKPVVEAK